MLAYIADTVAFSRADYVNAHGGSMRPTALPRPGDEDLRQHARDVHDALYAMATGNLDPEVVASLKRDGPAPPQVETV